MDASLVAVSVPGVISASTTVPSSILAAFIELSVIPDPVFEPNFEKNIDRQTCISYQVKEGDYIQVISPAGRQCSDFVAFDTRKLDKGIEKGLDWQTTRTFTVSYTHLTLPTNREV